MINNDIEYLREKEKSISQKVIALIKDINPQAEAIYLPNVEPNQKVDYFFITMEPSFGTWARTEKNADTMIDEGLRNFLWSIDDFLFHYSIYHFLSANYYITDISKVAVKTKTANDTRKEVYKLWKEHLVEEIRIIGNDNSKLFLVGNTVAKWMRNNFQIIDNNRIVGKILHYSPQAANKRKYFRNKDEIAYQEFFSKENITEKKVCDFTEILLNKSIVSRNMINKIFNRISNKLFMTESRKELIYSYYKIFSSGEEI